MFMSDSVICNIHEIRNKMVTKKMVVSFHVNFKLYVLKDKTLHLATRKC